jgi:hypothetical protein
MRAAVSTVPPAGNGTTSLTGRLGHDCAAAGSASMATSTATRQTIGRIGIARFSLPHAAKQILVKPQIYTVIASAAKQSSGPANRDAFWIASSLRSSQ